MSAALDERAFQAAYRAALETVADELEPSFVLPASADLLTRFGYLAACEPLYVEVLAMLRRRGEEVRPARALDAGGSFGVFGAALRSLGVAVVESSDDDDVDLVVGLALHGQSTGADEIAAHAGRLSRHGRLVLVVPSRGYWRVRLAELRGRRPETPAGAPQLGKPSYGRSQLVALLRGSGLRPDLIRAREYSPVALGGPLLQTVAGVATRVAPRHREVWLALASPVSSA